MAAATCSRTACSPPRRRWNYLTRCPATPRHVPRSAGVDRGPPTLLLGSRRDRDNPSQPFGADLRATAVSGCGSDRLTGDNQAGVGGQERPLVGGGRNGDERAAGLVDLRRLQSRTAAGLYREFVDAR